MRNENRKDEYWGYKAAPGTEGNPVLITREHRVGQDEYQVNLWAEFGDGHLGRKVISLSTKDLEPTTKCDDTDAPEVTYVADEDYEEGLTEEAETAVGYFTLGALTALSIMYLIKKFKK